MSRTRKPLDRRGMRCEDISPERLVSLVTGAGEDE